jgi:hypothetical protein
MNLSVENQIDDLPVSNELREQIRAVARDAWRDGYAAATPAVDHANALHVIGAFAQRTMPHADGQGHLALMGIASMCAQALRGETLR